MRTLIVFVVILLVILFLCGVKVTYKETTIINYPGVIAIAADKIIEWRNK